MELRTEESDKVMCTLVKHCFERSPKYPPLNPNTNIRASLHVSRSKNKELSLNLIVIWSCYILLN